MIRHVATLTLSALLAASSVACEKQGATERQKEQQANEPNVQEKNEANEKMQTAQNSAAAEKEVAGSRADFEKTREDYRHSRTVDLNDIDTKIADLEAKEKAATGAAKADLEGNLTNVRTQREAFVREMHAVDRATPATWADAKANADRTWDSLKDAVDKAQGSPKAQPSPAKPR